MRLQCSEYNSSVPKDVCNPTVGTHDQKYKGDGNWTLKDSNTLDKNSSLQHL